MDKCIQTYKIALSWLKGQHPYGAISWSLHPKNYEFILLLFVASQLDMIKHHLKLNDFQFFIIYRTCCQSWFTTLRFDLNFTPKNGNCN